MLIIEHDMPLIMSISERVYCLESGTVIAEGEPDAVRGVLLRGRWLERAELDALRGRLLATQQVAREAAARPIEVAPPGLPEGELLLSGYSETRTEGGRLAGDAMVELLGETGGKVAVLDYPDVESCQLRTQGFQEKLDAHNAKDGAAQIEIVSVLNGKGAREAGYSCAQDIVTAHPDLAAIFAINDPSALGAYAAFEEAGLQDQITIIGFDGEKAGKEAILAGKILCDPIQFPDRMGRRTVELITQYFAGDDVPKEELIPSKLYYKADAEQDPELQSEATAD